jgi:hypothetical protein
MKLLEVVSLLPGLDDTHTIYAKQPWSCTSEAILAVEPTDGGLPLEAKQSGLEYFLEVFIAKEFLEGWFSNLQTKPTLLAQCERLVQYAENDA